MAGFRNDDVHRHGAGLKGSVADRREGFDRLCDFDSFGLIRQKGSVFYNHI